MNEQGHEEDQSRVDSQCLFPGLDLPRQPLGDTSPAVEAQELGHRERVALRKLGSPANFRFHSWQCMGTDAVLLSGCVVTRTYTKGPRKGRPVYDGKRLEAVVLDAELAAERVRWVAETGKCGECLGRGTVTSGWHHQTGWSHRECHECKGSGSATKAGAVDPIGGSEGTLTTREKGI